MYLSETERLRIRANDTIVTLNREIDVYKIGRKLLELVHGDYKPSIQCTLKKMEQQMKANLEEAEAMYKQIPSVASEPSRP
jgi:hypothetical protein